MLNAKAIFCLKTVLLPARLAVGERLARARALRNALAPSHFSATDTDKFKREGRK